MLHNAKIEISDPRLRVDVFNIIKEMGLEVEVESNPIKAIVETFSIKENYDLFHSEFVNKLLERGYTFLEVSTWWDTSTTISENGSERKEYEFDRIMTDLEYEKSYAQEMLRVLKGDYSLSLFEYIVH